MDHLLRDLAPVDSTVWATLDDEAAGRLAPQLGARRVVDFRGPAGWQHSAYDLHRAGPAESLPDDGSVRQRRVLPLTEVRLPFTLPRTELEDAARGAEDLDYGPLDAAADALARLENAAVLLGRAATGIGGVAPSSSHDPLTFDGTPESLLDAGARAVLALEAVGIGGPYALTLDDDLWVLVRISSVGGSPLLPQLEEVLHDGSIVWAPGSSGAIVLSTRGGDHVFDCGQDISIGYLDHDDTAVRFYLEESFTFHVNEPDAGIAIARP